MPFAQMKAYGAPIKSGDRQEGRRIGYRRGA